MVVVAEGKHAALGCEVGLAVAELQFQDETHVADKLDWCCRAACDTFQACTLNSGTIY